MKRCLLLAILVTILFSTYSQGDETKFINQKRAGLLIEYAQPFYYITEENTRYYALLMGGVFGFPLYKSKNFFNVSLDLYPHYGYIWMTDVGNFYELGFNVRLGLNFLLTPKDVLSFRIGAGPHYTTIQTRRQADGFIFSDNFLAVYARKINISGKAYAIEFEAGYRHISNASTQNPNGGVSNFLFGIGFYRCF